jgi:AICAR transformylase/IMP cyclohydrolase PurH
MVKIPIKKLLFNKLQIKSFKFSTRGKNLGYNNILDISDGLSCLKEFEEPTCVIINTITHVGCIS